MSQHIMTDQERHDQNYGIKRDPLPLAMPPQRPRPVGISTVMYQDTLITSVVFDDGSVWENESGQWSRLPRIPQGGK